MIQIKPAVYNINAFDSADGQVIEFQWVGNQAFRNICIIRNNATNTIIYQNTQETMQLKHTIPSNALNNGVLYNLTIQVIDINNNISSESDPVLFYCFTKPIFSISNLAENQVVQNSSYQLDLFYSQLEGEILQSYQVLLYNMNKNQIWNSGIRYDVDNLRVTLMDLDDNGVYFVRATGYTINGMYIETDYIRFSVNYIMPSVYALLTLENIDSEGSIKLQSNIIALEGKFYSGEPSYIDGEYIDLTNPNNYVYFNEGYSAFNDFTINIKGYNFANHSTILRLSNGKENIVVNKHSSSYLDSNYVEKVFFELKVPSSTFSTYVIFSNMIDTPSNGDILSIWLKRKNNIYELYVENSSA